MSYVFTSFSHTDSGYANKLNSELLCRGFALWMGERLEDSDHLPVKVIGAIRTCAAFTVIWSRAAEQSVRVKQEVRSADGFNKPIFAIVVGEPEIDIPGNADCIHVSMDRLPDEAFFERLAAVAPAEVRTHVLPPERKPSVHVKRRNLINDLRVLLANALSARSHYLSSPPKFIVGKISVQFGPTVLSDGSIGGALRALVETQALSEQQEIDLEQDGWQEYGPSYLKRQWDSSFGTVSPDKVAADLIRANKIIGIAVEAITIQR